jgi:hypothetical protein
MDEISERLRTRRALVKIGSFPPEGVGGDHRLRLKTVSADRTAQLDVTQRRHVSLYTTPIFARGNFCAM